MNNLIFLAAVFACLFSFGCVNTLPVQGGNNLITTTSTPSISNNATLFFKLDVLEEKIMGSTYKLHGKLTYTAGPNYSLEHLPRITAFFSDAANNNLLGQAVLIPQYMPPSGSLLPGMVLMVDTYVTIPSSTSGQFKLEFRHAQGLDLVVNYVNKTAPAAPTKSFIYTPAFIKKQDAGKQNGKPSTPATEQTD
ncbi:MAG: hypothetical protein HQK81_14880 [Desulfovibrionaceae bacterium]|nr:hypothetical protein [Desulfovibrionaceae bacterium]